MDVAKERCCYEKDVIHKCFIENFIQSVNISNVLLSHKEIAHVTTHTCMCECECVHHFKNKSGQLKAFQACPMHTHSHSHSLAFANMSFAQFGSRAALQFLQLCINHHIILQFCACSFSFIHSFKHYAFHS